MNNRPITITDNVLTGQCRDRIRWNYGESTTVEKNALRRNSCALLVTILNWNWHQFQVLYERLTTRGAVLVASYFVFGGFTLLQDHDKGLTGVLLI